MQQNLFNPWFVDENNWGIEIITENEYKGTVIQIKSLDFVDNSNDVSLDFHIISKPDGINEEEYKKEEFNNILQASIELLLRKVIDEHASRETNSK